MSAPMSAPVSGAANAGPTAAVDGVTPETCVADAAPGAAAVVGTNVPGTHRIVEALRREGIRAVFGYPGGAIMPLYDAFAELGVDHVLVRHEQAAAHAAAGYALAGGSAGVCVATSGPGATNLVTGLADALLDSIPVVALTGQVPTSLIGTDAFQEIDTFGLTLPVVKHSFLAERPDRLCEQLWKAFRIATGGRPGPVLVDLPKDVQLAPCRAFTPRPGLQAKMTPGWDGQGLEAAIDLLRRAERPLVYAGGGIFQGRARAAFRAFAEHLGAPVVCTLKGLGALPTGHPQLLGMMGMHGLPRANRALRQADLLLVIGARFDDRATGKLAEFCPQARVVHFEVDPAEIGKLRRADVALCGPLAETLPAVTEALRGPRRWHPGAVAPEENGAPWEGDGLCPRDLLAALDADVVTTDVGQHQMWAAQYLRCHDGMQLMTSGGLGTMGFGLPAAIGAQIARPESRVVCVTGDGSLMMMIHELATLRRYALPVRVVLFDNGCLGMVRQQQELLYGNRESEIDLGDNPDFAAVAAAFGIAGRTLTHNSEIPSALAEAERAAGPFLLHCKLDRQANVWPFVPAGKGNHEMLFPEGSGAHALRAAGGER